MINHHNESLNRKAPARVTTKRSCTSVSKVVAALMLANVAPAAFSAPSVGCTTAIQVNSAVA